MKTLRFPKPTLQQFAAVRLPLWSASELTPGALLTYGTPTDEELIGEARVLLAMRYCARSLAHSETAAHALGVIERVGAL